MEMDEGTNAEVLAEWVKQEHPDYDWKEFGFQEFSELLNFAQDKLVVRVTPHEESGLMVFLGPEFHPPAPPEVPPEQIPAEEEEVEEPQPIVAGQPTADEILKPVRRRQTRKVDADGNVPPPKKRAPRRKKEPASI
jgi:hypothetical protein